MAPDKALAASLANDRDTFVRSASALSYFGRVHAARHLGERARDDVQAQAIVRALEQGDVYERHLAAWSLHGRRDGQAVVATLKDPSLIVRNVARSALGRCSDREAVEALHDATLRGEHKPLLRHLARHRRRDAIDTYLDERARRGDAKLAPLLRFASRDYGARAAARLLADPRSPTAAEWTLLADERPLETSDRLFAIVRAATPIPDRIAEARLATAMTRLAARDPDAALARLGAAIDLGIRVYETVCALAESRPIETFDLCFAKGASAPPSTALVLTTRSGAEALALLEKRPFFFGDFEPLVWMRPAEDALLLLRTWWALTKSENALVARKAISWAHALHATAEREEYFTLWARTARHPDTAIPPQFLDGLPPDLVAREVKHALEEVPGVRSSPDRMTSYAQRLPYDRMELHVAPLLKHPEVDVRAACLETLLGLATTPDERMRALERFAARPNERDPLRERLLRTLVQWPGKAWTVGHLAYLGKIVSSALDALDLGAGSRVHVGHLVDRAFAVDPAWAAARVLEMQRTRGGVTFDSLPTVTSIDPPANLDAELARIAGVWIDSGQVLPLHALFARGAACAHDVADVSDPSGRKKVRVAYPLPELERQVERACRAGGATTEIAFALQAAWTRHHPTIEGILASVAENDADEGVALRALIAIVDGDRFDGTIANVTTRWSRESFPERALLVLRAVPYRKGRVATPALLRFVERAIGIAGDYVKAAKPFDVAQSRAVTTLLVLLGALASIDAAASTSLAAAVVKRLVSDGYPFDAVRILEERGLPLDEVVLSAIEAQAVPANAAGWVSRALDVLRANDKDRYARVALRLIDEEPSAIALPPVVDYLAWNRQDLIVPAALETTPAGSFDEDTKPALDRPTAKALYRLTREQQHALGRALVRDALAETAVDQEGFQAVERAARLPCAPSAALALAEAPRPPVRDAGLFALGRLDGPEGIPLLITCLDDDRARIAAYALRSVLSRLSPAQALPHLRAAPLTKVTAAKEIVRLAGALGTPDARRFLVELDGYNLHRDVRIALLRAFWDHLAADETWDVYARAAQSDDEHVATSLLRLPGAELTDEVDARFSEIIALLVSHPKREVRLISLAGAGPTPIRDKNRVVVAALLQSSAAGPHDEVPAAFRSLLTRSEEIDVKAVSARLPEVQAERVRLVLWSRGLMDQGGGRITAAVAAALLDLLANDILMRVLYLRLGTRFWSDDVARRVLEGMVARGDLHHDAFVEARKLLESRRARIDWLDALAVAWTALPHEALRRLALVALALAAVSPSGWTPARVALLQRARQDRSPLVAGAAELLQAGGLP